jgi:hypothetical protein
MSPSMSRPMIVKIGSLGEFDVQVAGTATDVDADAIAHAAFAQHPHRGHRVRMRHPVVCDPLECLGVRLAGDNREPRRRFGPQPMARRTAHEADDIRRFGMVADHGPPHRLAGGVLPGDHLRPRQGADRGVFFLLGHAQHHVAFGLLRFDQSVYLVGRQKTHDDRVARSASVFRDDRANGDVKTLVCQDFTGDPAALIRFGRRQILCCPQLLWFAAADRDNGQEQDGDSG